MAQAERSPKTFKVQLVTAGLIEFSPRYPEFYSNREALRQAAQTGKVIEVSYAATLSKDRRGRTRAFEIRGIKAINAAHIELIF